MITFAEDERLALIDRLEDRGLFIDALWNLSDLYYTDSIKTAAVSLSGDRIRMLFNKEFYESLGYNGQMFVVCHEQLHIMSNHFERMEFGQGDSKNKNIAADVSINHALERNYFFERTDLPEWEKYCWTDTVFPNQMVSDNETAEYYYMLLKQKEDRGEAITGEPIDEHSPDGGDNTPSKIIKEAIAAGQKQLKEQLEADDSGDGEIPADLSNELDKEVMHGSGSQTHNTKAKASKSWKSIYMQIPKSLAASRHGTHWISRNRNHRLLPSGLMMPGDFEISYQEKVQVHVYLDTSGSCVDHAIHFLKSALTLPPNLFEVNMFGFCANVYELPKKPPFRLHGFGAECYQSVENHVNEQKRVDAVMVFTDGHSKQVEHENPRKWHWFITPDGTTDNIDRKCNTYMLEKFGWPMSKG